MAHKSTGSWSSQPSPGLTLLTPRNSFLHLAVRHHDWPVDVLSRAIDQSKSQLSVNIRNDLNETPLHAAAMRGNSVHLRWLLEHGAEVNPPARLRMAEKLSSILPIHSAILSGSIDCIELLLGAGADISYVCQSLHGNAEELVRQKYPNQETRGQAIQLVTTYPRDRMPQRPPPPVSVGPIPATLSILFDAPGARDGGQLWWDRFGTTEPVAWDLISPVLADVIPGSNPSFLSTLRLAIDKTNVTLC